ncbi:MAG: hypothetical protein P9L97_06230 [Candidatus Tenebribacter davisii]|nr:hypothetical protein [Candidatus Tenebribacter davisii]
MAKATIVLKSGQVYKNKKVPGSPFGNNERMIASLEFEGLISDKSKPGIYSLYLPRNLELRPERNDADTLDDLQNR